MFYHPECVLDGPEYNQWLKKLTIQEIIVGNFFNSSDYTTPIRSYLDDIWISLVPGQTVFYETFFKNNILNLQDDLVGLFNDKVEDNFFQVSRNNYFPID
jgi:hypothetical protein